MRVAIVTLFPELLGAFLTTSLVGRAERGGQLAHHVEPLREHGLGQHKSVDDTPYGGGSGMVMRVDSVVAAIEHAELCLGGRSHRVLLTPQGEPFCQRLAHDLSRLECVTLVCGRYEGFDDRVRMFVEQEISLGDYVLIGGEVAAMVIIEAVVRLLPGVLGNSGSTVEESFSLACSGLLEYPQYTRPVVFRGLHVPDVLCSGDHGRIRAWRQTAAGERTQRRRPELLSLAATPGVPQALPGEETEGET
ncbi:tRNA (guanosine(37)-N1)-methyltransferase TrmD [Myxococcota bacterium]